jgi:DNA-binding beta-propeller fold protein YncE
VGVVPARGEAFIVNSLAGTISRVSLERFEVVEELSVGRAPVGLTIGSAFDRVYVSNRGAGTLSVIGVEDGLEWAQFTVGEGPGGVAVIGRRVYVADAGSGTLTILDDDLEGAAPTQNGEQPNALIGKKLPRFELVDLNGTPRSSEEWAEKKYIVNFFASW